MVEGILLLEIGRLGAQSRRWRLIVHPSVRHAVHVCAMLDVVGRDRSRHGGRTLRLLRLSRCHGGSGVRRDYVRYGRWRHARASHEKCDKVPARFDALDGLAVRHLVGIAPIYLQYLVPDLQTAVQSRWTLVSELENEQWYVELFTAAYAEPETARQVLPQLDHVVLVLIDNCLLKDKQPEIHLR